MEFTKPTIFYYLILLAIPIIIHLFNFRKHKKIFFSNNYFLKQIQTKSQSKNKIKKWLLLLNRMAIVCMIITAFSLPFLKQNSNPHETKKVGLYVDNSFSMNKVDENNNSLLDYAKNNAKKIINNLIESQQVLIITNDFEKKHQKWYSAKEALSLIDSISISGNPNKLNTVINKYDQNLDSRFSNELYLLSDFQKKKQIQAPDSLKNLTIKIGLLQSNFNDSNISIDSCYFSTPFRKNNEIENLNVIFTNHGNENLITNAQLFINKQKKSTHSIDLPAKSSITKTINYVNPIDQNNIRGKIVIDDPVIQFDNQMFFSYSTNNQIPVLAIFDDNISNYLTNLFSDSIFNFQSYNINQIEYNLLNNFNLIILDELTNIPSSLASRLQQYISNKKAIFIFPNQKIDKKSYNDFFKKINTDFLDKWIEKERLVEIINYNHPLFQSVFLKNSKNINLPKIQGSYLMRKNNSSQKRSILNFKKDSPFLSEYIYKSGRIFLVASDLSSYNSNFPEHALFVPCLYNASIINNEKNIYNTIKNENIIETNTVNTNNTIRLEKNMEIDLIGNIISPNLVLFSNKINTDGYYKLIINDTTYKTISFNYNRNESTTNYFNKKEIKETFKDQSVEFLKMKNNLVPFKDLDNNKKNTTSLFFIILAIIFLIIELILLRIWKI